VQDATIIGAGPYGLSIAAHLNDRLHYRIFGRPMASWREQMPRGMHLKSEGFATSLSDPNSAYRLQDYCAEQNEPYCDMHQPIPIDQFIGYGLAFQRRFIPSLEETYVASVTRNGDVFTVRLVNDEVFATRQVIVAAGISHFAHTPDLLKGPRELISHTADHSDLSHFRGKTVVVVGAGASAIDTAVLLSDIGASVTVLTRRREIPFLGVPKARIRFDQMRVPMTGLGPGLRSWRYVAMPEAFHAMPEKFRLRVTRTRLGPGPAHFMRHRYEGAQIQTIYNATPFKVTYDRRVSVTYDLVGKGCRTVHADHVIAATGYRVDLSRLSFLSNLLPHIKMVENTPILTRQFESSMQGLYFVGAAAVNSFGPAQRFVYGADYTSRALVRALIGLRAENSRGLTGQQAQGEAVEADAQFFRT
jgi:cation diffusion facilitator CzcD-associated flavoprotein CzcO